MFDELATIMQERVDPSVWDGVVALTQALDIHEANGYRERIVALYNEGNRLHATELVDQARAILLDQAEVLLQQMGLVLDVQVLTLQRLAEIVRILAFVPNDMDTEALAAILQSEDTMEALSEVLAIYLNEEPVETIDTLLEVDPTTVAAIKEVLQANVSYSEQPELNIQLIAARLHNYQHQVGPEPTIALESLHQGIQPGTNADELVRSRSLELGALPVEQMADELVGIALLGNIPDQAIRVWVLTQLESMVDDPLVMQRGYKRVTSRLAALKGIS